MSVLPNENDAMFHAYLTENIEVFLDGKPVTIDEMDAERFDCLPDSSGDGCDIWAEIYISTHDFDRLEIQA